MNTSYLIITLTFLSCFFVAYLWFAAISRNLSTFSFSSRLMKDVFTPIWTTSLLGVTALYFLLPNHYDQIFKISYLNITGIYLAAALIYLGFSYKKTARFSYLYLLAGTLLGTALLPSSFLMFEGLLPFWLDRLAIIFLWTAFAWCYKYLNGIDAIIGIQTITPLFGMTILAFIGAIPVLTGSFCAVMIAVMTAFLIYNWYPAQLLLTSAGCQALGFLSAWFFISGAQEGAGSCILIFNLYYIIEILWALLKKLSRKSRYQNVTGNTFYYQTNVSGLSPAIIAENIFKLEALLIIFGGFQVYAPNNYSLAIISVILVLWFLNHLRNWQHPERSLSEINREVIKELKENVDDFKKNIDKDI